MEKIFRQCSKSNNPADLDTYIADEHGIETLVYCCNADRQEKAKKEKVRY